jgi:hypothetical protein
VNLGTARIVVIVALVVAGVAILFNGFGDESAALPDGGAASGSPTPTATSGPSGSSPTSSPTTTPLPDPLPPAEVTVAVFNGTNVTGLAAQADQTLTDAGYVSGQVPADAPAKPIGADTKIYYRGGPDAEQNQADAQEIADSFFKGATVEELGVDFDNPETLAKDVQVVVVLGDKYAQKHP